MTVLPEYGGNGVGTGLILKMEKWCRKNGIKKIELSVWSGNTWAIGLYKKLDYLLEGTRKSSVLREAKYQDLVLMGKWIA